MACFALNGLCEYKTKLKKVFESVKFNPSGSKENMRNSLPEASAWNFFLLLHTATPRASRAMIITVAATIPMIASELIFFPSVQRQNNLFLELNT